MKLPFKSLALKACSLILLLAGILDIVRGFTHTFRVNYAAENLAKIEVTSDSLVLMSAFGISNFLTGFLFLLIVFKANRIVPYVLFLIPFSYLIGGIGMQYSSVVMESEFKGQHMMKVYLVICLFMALFYFVIALIDQKNSKTYTSNM